MAVQSNNITRGGKGYTVTEGITPEGKSRVNIQDQEPDPVHDQPVKRAPIKLEIFMNEGELNGEVWRIVTTWKTAMISNGEKPLEGNTKTETMTTSAQDMAAFVGMFAPALKFMINGYGRADMGGDKTGWNDMPVFGAQGQLLTYTEEQENQAPDNHYYNPPQPTE